VKSLALCHRLAVLPIVACAALVAVTPLVTGWASTAPPPSPAVADVSELIVYRRGEVVPQDQFVDLGPPGDLGGQVLEGDPAISARVDFADGAFTAGVFQATRGKVLIHFPFTEHATILSGSVELTDATGVTVTLRPGDSYLITQGSNILWNVRGPRVQKSFANRVAAADRPGPMRIYRAHAAVPAGDLVDLGPPEALGGVVLGGDPQVAARFDLADASAGLMVISEGALRIDFAFAAHAAVTRGRVQLTDRLGRTATLRPGDAYFVRPGAVVRYDLGQRPLEQSFFHTVL
jgi:uncharacterized cupin superfamily protein